MNRNGSHTSSIHMSIQKQQKQELFANKDSHLNNVHIVFYRTKHQNQWNRIELVGMNGAAISWH